MGGNVQDAILRLVIDSTQAKQGAESFNQSTQKTKTAAKEAAAAVDKMSASMKDVAKSAQSASTASEAVNKMRQNINNAARAHSLFGEAVKLQSHQLTNLSYQLQDVATQAAMGTSAFQVMAQQGPQIVMAMGGLKNALALLLTPLNIAAAAVAALGAGFAILAAQRESSERAFKQIESSLSLTGRAAELTRSQMRGLIEEAARLPDMSRDLATKAIAEFARMKNLSGAQIRDLTLLVNDYATATGQDVPSAAAAMARGLKDPAGMVLQLSEQFGGLTVQQYRAIEALQKSGKQADATKLAIEALKSTVADATKNSMTPFQEAMSSLGNAWEDLTSSFKDLTWVQYFLKGIGMGVSALSDFFKWLKGNKQESLNSDLDDAIAGKKAWQNRMDRMNSYGPGYGPNKYDLAQGDYWQKRIEAAQKARVDYANELQAKQIPGSSGAPGSAATGVNQVDVAAVSGLLDKYGGLSTQRKQIEQDISALNEAFKAGAINSDQYAAAVGRANSQLAALQEPVKLAQDALAREAEILSKPIGQRELYRAKIEATTQALLAGRSASEAAALGHIAEQRALLQMRTAAKDQLTELDNQIEATKNITAARSLDYKATLQQQAANEAYAASLKNPTVQVQELTNKLMELQKVRQQDAYAQDLQDRQQEVQLAQAEYNMIGKSAKQRSHDLTLMREKLKLEKQYPLLTQQERDALLDLTDQQIKLNAEAGKLNGIFDEARSSLEDAFTDALDGSTKSFKDFASNVGNIIKRMAAQIATQLIFTPIINGVMGGGTSGSTATASSLLSMLGTASSGGSVAGQSLSLLGSVANVSGLLGPLSGVGSSSLVNGIGAQLGFGNLFTSSGVSAGWTSASLGSVLGGAGLGFGAGNLLNTILGGNQTNGMYGSGAGAAAGAMIGSVVPVVGTVIGGLLGGLLGGGVGGLFGGKPSDKTQGGTLNLSTLEKTTNGLGGKKFSQENADYRDALLDAASTFAKMIQSTGATTSGTISVAIGSRDGLRVNGKNYGYNNEAVLAAVMNSVLDGAQNLSDTFKTISKTLGFKDMNELATAFDFGIFYDSLVKPAKAAATATDDLSKAYDEYIAKAQKYGLSVSAFTEGFAKQFDSNMLDAITAIEDPYSIAIKQFETEAQARLDYATKVGADIVQVEKYNALLRKEINVQYGKDTTEALKKNAEDLKKWLDNELTGANSSLTPMQQFTAAQKSFADAISTARAAGASADIGSVTSAADSVLSLGRTALGGATEDYASLETLTRSMVTELGKSLGLPGFATGGEFFVGGNGGTDSQLVAFRATPGERVKVSNGGGGDMAGFRMLALTMQKEMGDLKQEMQTINRNLKSSQTTNLLIRKDA